MRKTTTYTEDFTLANGDEVELELEFCADQCHDAITVVETATHIVVGYLVQDDDCSNPLEDCDGIGSIHHHPRSRYGKRDDDGYSEALGLDSGGDPIIDEAKLQKLWSDSVMALHLKTFHIADRKIRKRIMENGSGLEYRAELRAALAEATVEDVPLLAYLQCAWRYFEVPPDLRRDMAEILEDLIKFDYAEARKACAEPGNPDTVLLDMYEHGGCVWSVSGTGMNCRWDTSRGESVWVPDKYALEEILRRAPVYDHAWIEHTSWIHGTGKSHLLHFGNKEGKFSDDWSELWNIAVSIAALGGEPKFNGRDKATLELAECAVEQYNAWSSGDCYGVVTQVHDKNGDMIEQDACWGFIGSDYAKEELAGRVKYEVEHAERSGRNPDGAQVEMRI